MSKKSLVFQNANFFQVVRQNHHVSKENLLKLVQLKNYLHIDCNIQSNTIQ